VGETKPKSHLKPLPSPIEAEVQKIAQEIVIERTAEGRKVAALELANKLLATVANLLQHAQNGQPVSNTVPKQVLPTIPDPLIQKVDKPCMVCGHQGVWKDKPNRFNPKPGWLCQTHAQVQAIDNAQEAAGSMLAQSLRNAAPIIDASLPE
jgi:hypothetical protein